jgi:hypothetical protein
VTFVADRGLCSRHNLAQLEQAQCQYVVGMPLRRTLKQTQAAEVQQALPTSALLGLIFCGRVYKSMT